MFNSREKLQKAIHTKNWSDIIKAGKSDWFWLKNNAYPSLVYEAARYGYWDVVEYVINTFKRDNSGELGYEHVCNLILDNQKTGTCHKSLLIAKQILANNPEIGDSAIRLCDPLLYLNASTRFRTSNKHSDEMAKVIKLGGWLLHLLDDSYEKNAVLKDVMPTIIQYALASLIYSLHREQSTLFYSQVIKGEICPLVTPSEIDTIIQPYLTYHGSTYYREYPQNARKLVKAQSESWNGFFGTLSADTTIFVKRLGSMLENNPKDIENYIHDFVKNRYIKGNGSEKNIIPALIAHNLITQKKVDEFKEAASQLKVTAIMDDWVDLGKIP